MLFLPYSTELRFNKRPVISYSITLICILVFYFQMTNASDVEHATVEYCDSIHATRTPLNQFDLLALNFDQCFDLISYLHYYGERGAFEELDTYPEKSRKQSISKQDHDVIVDKIKAHYQRFSLTAPAVLDNRLMYFPDSWNPWTMVTSSLAHADYTHIIFNLIFFLAFAPAVEILINNRIRFSAVLLALMFVTGIAYSLSTIIFNEEPIPTLGLSGVVMGMIGLAAYMMPRARIRVLFWFIIIIKRLYIPVWMLALWYIGWDTWEMLTSEDYGGINLVSHVSGGFAGYMLGMLWLRKQRDEVKGELQDEIEDALEERNSKNTLLYSGGRRAFHNQQQQKEFKRHEDEYMSKLYRYISTHQDSQALILILDDYEMQSASPLIYEQLFERVRAWGPSRALLCLGRLIINLYMQQRKYARALFYAEECLSVSSEFVLADPGNVLLLASMAKDSQQFELAYRLVRHARERYGEVTDQQLDINECRLMEIELMWKHLDRVEEARRLMRDYLASGQPRPHPGLVKLAHLLLSS